MGYIMTAGLIIGFSLVTKGVCEKRNIKLDEMLLKFLG